MAKLTEFETLEHKYQANPKSLVFARFAEALVNQGKESDAVEVLATGIELFPDYLTAYMVLAQAMRQEGNLAQAEMHFKKVLDLDDRCLGALKNLAEISQEQSKIKEAIDYYELLLELCPHHSQGKKAYHLLVGSDDLSPAAEAESTEQDLQSAENMMAGDDELSELGEELLGDTSDDIHEEKNVDVVGSEEDFDGEKINGDEDFNEFSESPEPSARSSDDGFSETFENLSDNIPGGDDLDSKWDELEQKSELDSSSPMSDIEENTTMNTLNSDSISSSELDFGTEVAETGHAKTGDDESGATMVLDNPDTRNEESLFENELNEDNTSPAFGESIEETVAPQSDDDVMIDELDSASPSGDDVLGALDDMGALEGNGRDNVGAAEEISEEIFSEIIPEDKAEEELAAEELDIAESEEAASGAKDVLEALDLLVDDVNDEADEHSAGTLGPTIESQDSALPESSDVVTVMDSFDLLDEKDDSVSQTENKTPFEETEAGEFEGFGDEVENIFDSMEDEKSEENSSTSGDASPPFMLHDEETTVFLSQEDLARAEEKSKKTEGMFESDEDLAKLEGADVEELSPLSMGMEEDESAESHSSVSPSTATVTLAEIYFKQGLREQSLDIYRQLAQREPENELIKKRIEEIEQSQTNENPGPIAYGEDRRQNPRPGIKIKKRRR